MLPCRASVAPQLACWQVVEFSVSKEAVLPTGLILTARHFVAGQFVDVVATSCVARVLRAAQVLSGGSLAAQKGQGFPGRHEATQLCWPGEAAACAADRHSRARVAERKSRCLSDTSVAGLNGPDGVRA